MRVWDVGVICRISSVLTLFHLRSGYRFSRLTPPKTGPVFRVEDVGAKGFHVRGLVPVASDFGSV